MLDLPPATLNPQATDDPRRNLADYALREAVCATAKDVQRCWHKQPNDYAPFSVVYIEDRRSQEPSFAHRKNW